MDNNNNTEPHKLASLQTQAEQMLINAIHMAEAGLDLREKAGAGEKYICYLCNISAHASELISEIQSSSKSFVFFAQKLCTAAIHNIDSILESDQSFFEIKEEYEKLLNILEQEVIDISNQEDTDSSCHQDFIIPGMSVTLIDDRLKNLDERQKLYDNALSRPSGSSVRSFKLDTEEKYPESWSKESLGDLDAIINLPSVPEDMFASSSRPTRSASLCSLKSLRKVKLYLHRAHSSDEDEEYEYDEKDLYLTEESNSIKSDMKTRKEDEKSKFVEEVKAKKSLMLDLISEERLQD